MPSVQLQLQDFLRKIPVLATTAYFDWVTIIFMFLGGMGFMLFYHMLKNEWKLIQVNTELRWYASIVFSYAA